MAKTKKSARAWPALIGALALVVFTLVAAKYTLGADVALLNPKGAIAEEQTRLLVLTTSIMLAFAGIILFFIYFFAWKYRETNQKNIYSERAGRSKLLVTTAWVSPMIIFVILAAIMLPATQKLAPQKSIESDQDEMIVRVVALRWKWLFMYPDHDIASVNFVQIPVDTPVRFELTADEAPMQSFWIPHLGGMLYSMTEHVNPLNLMGNTIGDYQGGAAEINGHGFSGMRFTTRVSSRTDFDNWVRDVSDSSEILDAEEYARLLEPSEYHDVATYSSPTNRTLFENLVAKYAGSHDHYGNTDDSENKEHHR